jgi:acyl transferase domain-containing protein/acyl-CoA synthetase (AMP-forming)/AMP-acid ligase II/NADPH:quinone reductase-like Zn-dependent oxidoreductase/acetylornithine/succinyldiaminopimelate/putrescine aminotransferase/predicted amino acid dehydrogenase/NAD(P)-dependent dehydrogenase (short-subunit alcohol dehydrogenase family)/acyl carrier protein
VSTARGDASLLGSVTVESFAHLLDLRAQNAPDFEAYTYEDAAGGNGHIHLTWRQLRDAALRISALLVERGASGQPVLLCYAPGLDFLPALFGCFYANAIAVPLPYADGKAGKARVASIATSSGAAVLLATSASLGRVRGVLHRAGLSSIELLASDVSGDGPAIDETPRCRPDSAALIQYTSGSTSDPKGVVIPHSSLLANSDIIAREFGQTPESRAVFWLPWFHDMGLVGGVLQPLYTNFPVLMMPPAGFLRNPVRWLHAVSQFGATTSGGPNFAYDLCVDRVHADELAGIDLSTWSVAFNGAERVRSETVERFTTRFGPYGFRRSAFAPCYGLSEATLLVSASRKPGGPTILPVDAERMTRNEVIIATNGEPVQRFVSSGAPPAESSVAIVDDRRRRLGELEVGEIWVAGPSIGGGYWRSPSESSAHFEAMLDGDGGRRFLRTGDLGFMNDGELYVVGRLRDLIVIRGRNHHPVDIEHTVTSSHADLQPYSAAAFSIEADSGERLVIVQELVSRVRRGISPTTLFSAIRRALGEHHGLDPYDIVLVDAPTIPRTSSGKIRRFVCRERYWRGELGEIASLRGGATARRAAVAEASPSISVQRTASAPVEDESIAIIGASCRFPGANGLRAFWQLLREGRDPITELPDDRNLQSFYDPAPSTTGKMNTRWGGFLPDVDLFDPHFFGISPREATAMDPQQRLLLEVGWEALESAGIRPASLAGSDMGVFVGIGGMDYMQSFLIDGRFDAIDAYSGPGNAHSIAANRLSYLLDLRGPSLAIDTACSSSLVAVHLACQSLRRGESERAIAGGVNLILAAPAFIAFSQARMLSPNGRCRTFDATADGYVRSEGCGVVVLKRLSAAMADGDPILGVIRGSAVNQDGHTIGIAAPNETAQTAVIREALRRANVDAREIGYVEAHGTGTPLGDLVELRALANVFRRESARDGDCLVGSVKSNIGHAETAAGMAGLLKVLGCFNSGEVPGQLHLGQINAQVDFAPTRLRIAASATPWPKRDSRRLAGISSFGFGGTNAHIVLEEPPAPVRPEANVSKSSLHLLRLSAKSEPSLAELTRRYADLLASPECPPLEDLCHDASASRSVFPIRLAVSAATAGDLEKELRTFTSGEISPRLARGTVAKRPTVAFLFAGQGSQYPRMTARLYEHHPVFRRAMEECDQLLRPYWSRSLIELLYGGGDPDAIHDTECAQPALFATEYALTEVWKSANVRPDAVCGHSVGEYVAACVAGIFSLEDALRLVVRRGALMQALPRNGAMAVLFAAEAVVAELVERYAALSIAAVNGPQSVVISGAAAAVDEVLEESRKRSIRSARLAVSHAFHSPLVEPMLAAFAEECASVPCAAPRIPLISNTTGRPHPDGFVPGAEYWTRHAREAVRFRDCLDALAGNDVFIEIGPSATLAGIAREAGVQSGLWIPTLVKGRPDDESLSQAMARAWCGGVDVQLFNDRPRTPGALPTYPFHRERFWFADRGDVESLSPREERGLLARGKGGPADETFLLDLSKPEFQFLQGHQVEGRVIVPAALYLDLIATVGGKRANHVRFMAMKTLGESSSAITANVAPTGDGGTLVRIHGDAPVGAKASFLATATIPPQAGADRSPRNVDLDSVRQRCATEVSGAELYRALDACGLQYSGDFRGVERVWRRDGEALGALRCVAAAESNAFTIHPALLDSAFHVIAAAAPQGEPAAAYVPIAIDELTIHDCPPSSIRFSHVRLNSELSLDAQIRCDVRLLDANGAVAVDIRGLQLTKLGRSAARAALENVLFEVEWVERPATAGRTNGTRHWLLLAEDALAKGIAESLLAEGQTVARSDDLPDSLDGITDVVCAWGLAESGPVDLKLCSRVMRLVQRLALSPRKLWIVTAGGQAVGGSGVVRPAHAMLWGLARTVARECPALGCSLIDLADASDCGAVTREVLAESPEAEIAVRAGRRFAPRLVACAQGDAQPILVPRNSSGRTTMRLEAGFTGMLDTLRMRRSPLVQVGRRDVEIEVIAAGLNFRDVMKALGIYPSHPGLPQWLGDECCGRVAALGDDVDGLAIGDEVIAIGPAALSSRLITNADYVVRKPRGLTAAEAAAIPIAFSTAWHALVTIGRVAPGDRVLIHAGAGGVGLAALQIARLHGAVLFATAGSEQKREYLRALGVDHVMDSRSLDFVDEISEMTGGEGIDVVLNSLAGAALTASLALLRAGGRFIEIGRRDIFENAPIGLRPFQRNLSFFAVDMESWLADDPRRAQALLQQLVSMFEEGTLRPIPTTLFAAAGADQAFHFMAQRKNIGKIVIDLADAPKAAEGGSYLITGGTGALGLMLARHLAESGVPHVTLLARNAPGERQLAEIADIEHIGTTIEVALADVCDRNALVRAVRGDLRGVIHAAGVLDDRPIAQLDDEAMANVLRPKVLGAWNLHELTAGLPLERFVMFGSIAAVFGSPGQANYSAANAFLDALAHARRAAGLPATTIDWGPWDDGMAARSGQLGRFEAMGMRPFRRDAALDAFDRALASNPTQIVAVGIDVARIGNVISHGAASPLLEDFLPAHMGTPARQKTADTQRLAAIEPEKRLEAVRTILLGEFAKITGTASVQLDAAVPLASYGLDSLMGLELVNAVERKLGISIPFDELSEEATIGSLAAVIAPLLDLEGASEAIVEPPARSEPLPDRSAAARPQDDSSYASLVRPQLGAMLRAARLDVEYVRASGDRMTGRIDGEELEVLDVVGGYGSTLFGHNHPELIAAARESLRGDPPLQSQGSIRGEAGALARDLTRIAGAETGRSYAVTFANSGAETVEQALKHALLAYARRRQAVILHSEECTRRLVLTPELRREARERFGETIEDAGTLRARIDARNRAVTDQAPLLIAIEGSFHGKTLGALRITSNAELQRLFASDASLRTTWLPRRGVDGVAGVFAAESFPIYRVEDGRLASTDWSNVVAVFVEPVQGEGGAHPLDPKLLAALREATSAAGVPLVADEIQSGMGRTGTFFAATGLGLRADYYCLGKSLGGGVAKIGALLVDVDHADPDFELMTTSTFAEDDYSSAVARRALQILERDGLADRCRTLGEHLLQRFGEIRDRFPDTIADVRGLGLLAGVELRPGSRSRLLRLLYEQKLLGALASGFLLHEEGIRISSTLGAPSTLRIEPSAYMTVADLDRVAGAIGRLAALLHAGNIGRVIAFLGHRKPDRSAPEIENASSEEIPAIEVDGDLRRVAFLQHFLDESSLDRWEPSLRQLEAGERLEVIERMQTFLPPLRTRTAVVRSASGERLRIDFYTVLATSRMIEQLIRHGESDRFVRHLRKMLDERASEHCIVAGLGGYLSIVTQNGKKLAGTVPVTTGNAFTVAMGVEGLKRGALEAQVDLATARLAAVGAAGNICGAYVREISRVVPQLALIGRPQSRRRLERLAAQLYVDALQRIAAGDGSSGLGSVIRDTHAVRQFLDRGEAPDGETLYRAIEEELRDAAPIRIHEDVAALRDCDVAVTASNSVEPIIHAKDVGERLRVVCDISVPPDLAPDVLTLRPDLLVLSGGMVRLPYEEDLELTELGLPAGHLYACMAETILLGFENAPSEVSSGEIRPEQVASLSAMAKKHGFDLGYLVARKPF